MITNDEILSAWWMGHGQFWAGTPEHANPYLMGNARRDQDKADLFTIGWRCAQREAAAVDKALQRMGAEG